MRVKWAGGEGKGMVSETPPNHEVMFGLGLGSDHLSLSLRSTLLRELINVPHDEIKAKLDGIESKVSRIE
jgi:hypothetical protein